MASSSSRRLIFSTGWPISCRRHGSIGIAITEDSRRTTGCERANRSHRRHAHDRRYRGQANRLRRGVDRRARALIHLAHAGAAAPRSHGRPGRGSPVVSGDSPVSSRELRASPESSLSSGFRAAGSPPPPRSRFFGGFGPILRPKVFLLQDGEQFGAMGFGVGIASLA